MLFFLCFFLSLVDKHFLHAIAPLKLDSSLIMEEKRLFANSNRKQMAFRFTYSNHYYYFHSLQSFHTSFNGGGGTGVKVTTSFLWSYRILLSIFSVAWMWSSFFIPISNLFVLASLLGTISRVPTTIVMTVIFMSHTLFTPQARFKYLFTFIFTLSSARSIKFFFFLINTGSGFLIGIR